MRIAAILGLLLLAACQRETRTETTTTPGATTTVPGSPQDMAAAKVDTVMPLPPTVVPRCEAGSDLGPDGAVKSTKNEFKAKEPIHFSMWLKEAPEGLQVSVKVIGDDDKELATVQIPATGLQIATMKIPPQKPGEYRLEGYWGGNRVCDKEIVVRK